MVLQKVENSESKAKDQIKIIVVATIPTQEVRETIIDGQKVRFVTIEEYLTEMANQ